MSMADKVMAAMDAVCEYDKLGIGFDKVLLAFGDALEEAEKVDAGDSHCMCRADIYQLEQEIAKKDAKLSRASKAWDVLRNSNYVCLREDGSHWYAHDEAMDVMSELFPMFKDNGGQK